MHPEIIDEVFAPGYHYPHLYGDSFAVGYVQPMDINGYFTL